MNKRPIIKSVIFAVLITAVIGACFYVYKSRSSKLLDKGSYSAFSAMLEEACDPGSEGFSSQRELMDLIESWAGDNDLSYKEDKFGNIIFNRPAIKRKKNVSPTLTAVSLNYETAADNIQILASAAAIALSDVESGRSTVVFVNDEKNLAKGYKGLSDKYISSKTKVIYLDKGASTYLSTGSFQQRYSILSVPAEREKNTFDTAVTVTISGIRSGVIGPGITKQPDPFSALSSLLTRLKTKSVDCRLADVSIGSNGNMYPVSLEVTFVLNSYNLASFTGYIDNRIKAWDKAYDGDDENMVYEYEVTDSEEDLPENVYSAETTDRITGVLYSVKSCTYKYSESDAMPEGKEPGDTYGINCLTNIKADDDIIELKIISQGADDTYTERIINDNNTAAELYDCSYMMTDVMPAFFNDKDSLSRMFLSTYEKVSKKLSLETELLTVTDNCFTPCSYFSEKNSKSDIIHIRTKGSDASDIANAILCYIKTKGNTSIF